MIEVKNEIETMLNNLQSNSDYNLQQILLSFKNVSDVMDKINIASEEQASGVQQINSTINEMDGITQENAQYAENNIKISQTTAEQAIHLENLMNMFKVSEDQPKINQPGNQQIEMASEENPALLDSSKKSTSRILKKRIISNRAEKPELSQLHSIRRLTICSGVRLSSTAPLSTATLGIP